MKVEQNSPSDLRVMKKIGTGSAFGTFGELLQGVDEHNLDFLVTFPIERYSHATFVSNPASTAITVFPSYKRKAQKLAGMILQHFDLPLGGRLEIDSTIPVGKGLASSSADLVATARAVASCYALDLSETLLQTFMQAIEPSDGVMYAGVVAFYHRKVELCAFLGEMPPLTVIGIDEGGTMDTVEFNKLPKPFTEEEKLEYGRLLRETARAIQHGDVRAIGEVATRSATLNQKLRPKRTLPEMLAICEAVEGLGVLVAHSGTCIGILLSPEDADYDSKIEAVSNRLEQMTGDVMIFHSLAAQQQL